MKESKLSDSLLEWYDRNKRNLPWREDPEPYHVWLSEIMLQQTRVETVKEYYARFLSVLPSVEGLAKAEEDVYLKLWEGLGYYSRVRNLHRAAQEIVEDREGEMPRTSEELRSLPGVGPYTAAAIASICFGEKIPAVDGNLLRVFARMTGYEGNIKSGRAAREARDYYLDVFSDDRPGDMNQALMDLGALLCVPAGKPVCGECPWRESCFAHEKGREEDFPVAAEKKKRSVEKKTVFLIYYDQRIALRKREGRGLLAGLYEFPNAEGKLSKKAAEEYVRGLGFDPVRITPLPAAKHIFSHREWHMTGYQVLADGWQEFSPGEPARNELFLATAGELDEVYSIPSAFGKYAEEIRRRYL